MSCLSDIPNKFNKMQIPLSSDMADYKTGALELKKRFIKWTVLCKNYAI
jgi:hypothetical protein